MGHATPPETAPPAEPTEAEILRAAMASDAKRTDAMIERITEANITMATRISGLERMIEQLARVAVAPQAAPPQGLGGLDQVLAIAKALREVAAPAPQTTMQDTIAMMVSVLDLRERIASGVQQGGDGAGNGFAAMVPALIGPLTTLLERESAKASAPARALPAPAAAPVPAPAPPPPPPSMPADTVVAQLLHALPGWAKLAITEQARANVSPDGIADHVLAMLPDDAMQKLADALDNIDETVTEMTIRIPAWVPYKAWLRKLLDAIYEKLRGELDDTSEGTGADDGDTSDDGDTDIPA